MYIIYLISFQLMTKTIFTKSYNFARVAPSVKWQYNTFICGPKKTSSVMTAIDCSLCSYFYIVVIKLATSWVSYFYLFKIIVFSFTVFFLTNQNLWLQSKINLYHFFTKFVSRWITCVQVSQMQHSAEESV